MAKMTRCILSMLLAVVVGLFLVHGNALTAQIKRGGTIRVGVKSGPNGWDPHISNSWTSFNHYEQMYQNLLLFNDNMEIES